MRFSLDELASLLHPQELELLAEIADELEDELRDHVDESGDQEPVRDDYLRAILGPDSPGPATRGSPPKPAPKPKDEPKLKAHEADYNEELADEVKEEAKHLRRLPAVPTPDEMRRLLETARLESDRDYLIIRLLYATGARRSEMENMRLADLQLKERKIFIRSSKFDTDRYVLIDKETARLLDDFVYGRALDDPIFDIEDRQFNRVVQRWGRKSGLSQRFKAQGRHFSSHSLRHAFATHLHESGIDLFVLRDLLGHRFLSTTRIYVLIGVGRRLTDYDQHHPLKGFDLSGFH